MIENVVSTLKLPLGVGVNLVIDWSEYIVPMAVEERYIIEAVCSASKLISQYNGFRTFSTPNIMIG